jgi:hypothetical protein
MWFLKVMLIFVLALIFYQDCKNRLVFWFLYPIMGVLAFIIQLKTTQVFTTITNVSMNLSFVILLLLVCYLYAKLKLKKHFTNEVIGIGDILFFIFISFSFATISFFVLFVFALLFSLLLHMVFKNRSPNSNVPLAGYMSLFFGVVYGMSFMGNSNFLYAY